jgi:hypothetical protein
MENEQLRFAKMKMFFDRPVRNRKKFENNYSHRGGANGVCPGCATT